MKRRMIAAATVAVLAVTPALAQDYNRDGVVDGADYVAWSDLTSATYSRYEAWPIKWEGPILD